MLRPATPDDWEAFTGRRAPGNWFGIVCAKPYLIEGLGAIYADVEGRHWITFERVPGVKKTKTAHAAAKLLLAEAKARGIKVHALADPSITGAVKWIERLGFTATDETREGHPVWVLN